VHTYDKDGLPLGQGSAVVVAPDTLITNCHVLRKAKSFKVVHDGTAIAGTLQMWDPARDVCQVKAPNLGAPAVELGDSAQVVVGQPVYALGNPKGLELTLSNGLVSALRHDGSQRLAMIQTSAPISHGSSGGGLFDTDGRLIGITSSGIDAGQNLNFALPVEYIRELPARHLAALQKNPPSPPPEPPAPVITVATRLPAAPVATPAPASPAPAAAPPQATVVATAPPSTQRVPFLNEARQEQYRTYMDQAPYPKACAISDNGHFACSGGTRPKDRSLSPDPKVRVLARCAELAGKPCMLYAVDNTIVYQPATPTPEP
jgi:serine protease Do